MKMPTTAPRPMLKLAQFATMLRLKLAPSSVLLVSGMPVSNLRRLMSIGDLTWFNSSRLEDST